MTLLLSHFPHELLQKIIIFASGTAETLLKCEQTCRAFRSAVGDDLTWRHVPVLATLCEEMGSDTFHTFEPHSPSYFKTYREYVCVTSVICYCWKEQVSSGYNVFIESHINSIESEEMWRILVQHVCETLLVFPNIFFRKDVLYTLAEVVQQGMLELLEGAHDMSCIIASCKETYPIVTGECLRDTKFCLTRHCDVFDSVMRDGFIEPLGLDRMLVYKCSTILLLSRRVGIVRMTDEAMDLAWTALIKMIGILIYPAIVELISHNERGHGKRMLAPGQTVFTVPPKSSPVVGGATNTRRLHQHMHTIVPRQIEATAKTLEITNKVYGFDSWHKRWPDDFWEQVEARYEYEEEEEMDPMELEDCDLGHNDARNCVIC